MARSLINLILVAAQALALAGPVLAAEGAHAVRPASEGIPLTPVAVPVVVDGRVVNYVFVTVQILPTPTAKVPVLREREPFFRDALVRAAHRTPFTRPDDYNSIDETRLKAALLAAAPGLVGAGQVRGIAVTKQQPKHTLRVPRPNTPPPAGRMLN